MNRTTPARAGFLLALALSAVGEPVPDRRTSLPETPLPPPDPPPDRQLDHYRERLGLSPEQTEQVRGILDASRRRQEEERKTAERRIRELLTDAQRATFDEMPKAPDPGGPRPASPARWIGPSIDDLQRELALTPEQRERIGTLTQSAADLMRKRFEEARAGGFRDTDWAAIRAEAERLYNETTEKVKTLLAPDQLPRYGKLLEERSRMLRHVFRRPETAAERIARAMEALRISDPDEAAAVRFLVERVVALQGELAEAERAAREKAEAQLRADAAGDAAARDAARAGRRDRLALEERLRKTQEELAQVTTARQELELIRLGLLR